MLLLFTLEGQRYALYVESVQRVLPMLALTPLPAAPEIIAGVFSLSGETIPVVNLRRRFQLPERVAALSDRLVIANTGIRVVALWVDSVEGFAEPLQEEFVQPGSVVPGLRHIAGLVTLANGLVLIQDLHQCLSLEEEQQLTAAIERG